MAENEKLIPKRRFQEFQNSQAWEQRRLNTIFSKIRNAFVGIATPYYVEKNIGHFYLQSNNVKDGQINRDSEIFINHEFYEKQKDKWLKTGDLVMVQSGHVGHTAVITEESNNLAAHALIMFNEPNAETNSYFLNYGFQTPKTKKQLDIITTGNTIKHILASEMSEFIVALPSFPEQTAIGNFFRTLDDTITLQQRKLKKTKALKSAYLSEMFPAEGERVPKRRFAEFTDEWEHRKFADVFVTLQNNTLSRAELNSERGIAKNIHYGDILIKFGECLDVSKEEIPLIENEISVLKYKTSYLQNGDVIFADAAEDETVGKCSEIVGVNNEILISGLHTIPCRPNQSFGMGYLGYYLNSDTFHNQLLPLIQGTKVSSISKSALKTTTILYPKSEIEQEKIGRYFFQLDNLIAHHQQKLDKLKNIKKSYLNEMFI